MTTFLRLLAEKDKAYNLLNICMAVRAGANEMRAFQLEPEAFRSVPGAPFAYWVTDRVRQTFARYASFSARGRIGKVGLQTSDDFRFLRTWWEAPSNHDWLPYAKGGGVSLMYQPIPLVVRTTNNFDQIACFTNARYPYLKGNARSLMHADMSNFGRSGITWTKSTTSPPSFRLMPSGTVYSVSGLGAFVLSESEEEIIYVAALMNSYLFKYLISLSLGLAAEGRKHYEIGLINKNPEPDATTVEIKKMSDLGRRAWSLKRTLNTTEETAHSFVLPAALRARLGDYDPPSIEAELARIQGEIDALAFDLYGFSESDRATVTQSVGADAGEAVSDDADDEDESSPAPADLRSGSLSWGVGVAFGRFDWRLATGEREPPPEPEPFDPLPAKSPGMLPDGADPFHAHAGILVDEPGHPHDLPRLVESVLERVDVLVPPGVRKWLQRDFFKEHLQQYSKSRRKAPIYWPLATASGSYTLWVYYPSLTSQTIYTAINDFVEPKLKSVSQAAQNSRAKTGRSRAEDRELERLQDMELELTELRDTLLDIAPDYKPNQDDGVQITAAPLWPLFRHKPWQKVLKETWRKLEKGDYDWAHLAHNYWPERVREKCRTDKSLAIAHGLEDLYEEPPEQAKKARGRKK